MSCSGSSPIDRLAQIGRSTSTRRATVQIRYASTNGVRIYRYVLYLQAMPQARTVMLALVLKLPLALLIVRILRHCLPPGFPYRCPDIPQVLMYILGHLHCSGHRGRQRHPLIEAGRRLWRLVKQPRSILLARRNTPDARSGSINRLMLSAMCRITSGRVRG